MKVKNYLPNQFTISGDGLLEQLALEKFVQTTNSKNHQCEFLGFGTQKKGFGVTHVVFGMEDKRKYKLSKRLSRVFSALRDLIR
jgi:hypothetical protein